MIHRKGIFIFTFLFLLLLKNFYIIASCLMKNMKKDLLHEWLCRFCFILGLGLLTACNIIPSEKNSSYVRINLNDTSDGYKALLPMDIIPSSKVAVAAMISPKETFVYYKALINYISKKTGVKMQIIQRKTYEDVNNLLKNNRVDMAFICSGAYVALRKEGIPVKIVAVPVINGKTTYQAYIITYKSSGIKNFRDLKGKSFAFTDPLSNTGYFYAISRIKLLGYNKNTFFKNFVFTHAHDISIQLVAKQLVDGASVDGLIYDYLQRFHPKRLKNVRIIEKSPFFGIPPIVVPASTPDSTLRKLQHVLFQMDKDTLGVKILKKILIDRFVPAKDSLYNSIRTMDKIIGP